MAVPVKAAPTPAATRRHATARRLVYVCSQRRLGAGKIVYSTTLHGVSTANTWLERRFDPDQVRDMKTSAASDFTVGGPILAAHAFNAGLVDECHLFICPVLVGQGKPAFPSEARAQLELLDEQRFGNGVVYLRHRTRS